MEWLLCCVDNCGAHKCLCVQYYQPQPYVNHPSLSLSFSLFLSFSLSLPPSLLSLPPLSLTHRVAGEHQIHELRQLIDDTFQQFALDDSEDDFDLEDCNNSLGGGADSTHNLVLPSLSSSSVGNLRDISDSDVIAPLTSSSSLAVGRGPGLTSSSSLAGPGLTAPSRPSRHSFA